MRTKVTAIPLPGRGVIAASSVQLITMPFWERFLLKLERKPRDDAKSGIGISQLH